MAFNRGDLEFHAPFPKVSNSSVRPRMYDFSSLTSVFLDSINRSFISVTIVLRGPPNWFIITGICPVFSLYSTTELFHFHQTSFLGTLYRDESCFSRVFRWTAWTAELYRSPGNLSSLSNRILTGVRPVFFGRPI